MLLPLWVSATRLVKYWWGALMQKKIKGLLPVDDEIQISHQSPTPQPWLVLTWCLLTDRWQCQGFEVLWAASLWVWPHVPFCFCAAVPRLSVLLGCHFTAAPTTAVGHWTSVSHRSYSLRRLCTGHTVSVQLLLLCVCVCVSLYFSTVCVAVCCILWYWPYLVQVVSQHVLLQQGLFFFFTCLVN